jgi:hypothetical protein
VANTITDPNDPHFGHNHAPGEGHDEAPPKPPEFEISEVVGAYAVDPTPEQQAQFDQMKADFEAKEAELLAKGDDLSESDAADLTLVQHNLATMVKAGEPEIFLYEDSTMKILDPKGSINGVFVIEGTEVVITLEATDKMPVRERLRAVYNVEAGVLTLPEQTGGLAFKKVAE